MISPIENVQELLEMGETLQWRIMGRLSISTMFRQLHKLCLVSILLFTCYSTVEH